MKITLRFGKKQKATGWWLLFERKKKATAMVAPDLGTRSK
jgi:hypothetical protein